ncbi:hypothetical protein ACIA6C_29610 [Streptomyces sp. NPDC051578]|uniref:hypothetical protein n=1 Tax=Streptomyces sp. NPDC051578 TaxID=3365662 RepID=UPI0037BC4365
MTYSASHYRVVSPEPVPYYPAKYTAMAEGMVDVPAGAVAPYQTMQLETLDPEQLLMETSQRDTLRAGKELTLTGYEAKHLVRFIFQKDDEWSLPRGIREGIGLLFAQDSKPKALHLTYTPNKDDSSKTTLKLRLADPTVGTKYHLYYWITTKGIVEVKNAGATDAFFAKNTVTHWNHPER